MQTHPQSRYFGSARGPRAAFVALLGLLALVAAGSSVHAVGPPLATAKVLTVYVPCGMLSAFFKVKEQYETGHPGVQLKLEFDRADALTDKILKEGATPDVHLSIGHVETDLLVQGGKVEVKTPVAFGRFRLALCANRSRRDVVTCVEDLAKPEVKTILLTPAANSSVGTYAHDALTKLGLWEKVAPKVTYLPTIKDCYRDLAGGKADASFAYIGCPLPIDPTKAEYSKVITVQTLDEGLYGGAVVFASVLKAAAQPAEAAEFVRFLQDPGVQALLAQIGLQPVGK
jgi:molybdate transport system substrate-binding protein